MRPDDALTAVGYRRKTRRRGARREKRGSFPKGEIMKKTQNKMQNKMQNKSSETQNAKRSGGAENCGKAKKSSGSNVDNCR